MVQLFAEVRRHKPSVIYIPSVDTWYRTIGPTVISTFLGLLRSLSPTDPVLLLGILESEPEYVDKAMLKSLFGFSKHNQFELEGPDRVSARLRLLCVVHGPTDANRVGRRAAIVILRTSRATYANRPPSSPIRSTGRSA